MPGERFTASAYLLIKFYAQPHTAYRTMLNFTWRMHDLPTLPRLNADRIWELGIA
ncbi:hypothetical protein ACYEXS_32175 [Paenibacillus sp. MAH-36]|uniref:Uncharacterized protein n=1 Tax=Paenibacillus violae TaxID=3077234 RepID=A0ABU3RD16_9BACL|nr:hypothetical protein [Paenibacillus sp. PFR10]MDU0202187.1 hypothetical protein [Paenibacillus sp. PFR10]